MFELKVKSKFSSAHFLREYNGKCENLHGHNWKVEIVICGNDLNNIGLLVDFKEIKEKLNNILNDLDHYLLNEKEFFIKLNPSCENISFYIYNKMRESLCLNNNRIKVKRVNVWETDDSCASYIE